MKNKNLFFYLFFLIIFLLGINVYKDYGLNLDDEWYRKNGELYYQYLKNLFLTKGYFVDIETLSIQKKDMAQQYNSIRAALNNIVQGQQNVRQS